MAENLKPRSDLTPTKILILRILKANGSQSIKQVCAGMGGLSYSAVGNALRSLWDMKMVVATFKGNKTFWRLKDDPKQTTDNSKTKQQGSSQSNSNPCGSDNPQVQSKARRSSGVAI